MAGLQLKDRINNICRRLEEAAECKSALFSDTQLGPGSQSAREKAVS